MKKLTLREQLELLLDLCPLGYLFLYNWDERMKLIVYSELDSTFIQLDTGPDDGWGGFTDIQDGDILDGDILEFQHTFEDRTMKLDLNSTEWELLPETADVLKSVKETVDRLLEKEA